jgi:SEC-C motif-containing protein
MDDADPCPCGGGRYAECCAPFHRGDEPPDAERLMRSRYSAFVLADLDYLWRTLHPDHDDRERARDEWAKELAAGLGSLRYRRLRILDRAEPDGDGVAQVLFHVTLSAGRRDASFAELSYFAHDGAGWRYLVGETRRLKSPDGVTIADWHAG